MAEFITQNIHQGGLPGALGMRLQQELAARTQGVFLLGQPDPIKMILRCKGGTLEVESSYTYPDYVKGKTAEKFSCKGDNKKPYFVSLQQTVQLDVIQAGDDVVLEPRCVDVQINCPSGALRDIAPFLDVQLNDKQMLKKYDDTCVGGIEKPFATYC